MHVVMRHQGQREGRDRRENQGVSKAPRSVTLSFQTTKGGVVDVRWDRREALDMMR